MSNLPRLGNISPIIPAGGNMEKAIAFYEQQLGLTTIHIEGDPVRMAMSNFTRSFSRMAAGGIIPMASWKRNPGDRS